MRTFIVELGTGADLHGGNATTAAVRAIQDSFNHVSLAGLHSVAGLEYINQLEVEVILGVPEGLDPVDTERVAAEFPYGSAEIKVQPGGLRAPSGPAGDFITVVNAAIFVRVP